MVLAGKGLVYGMMPAPGPHVSLQLGFQSCLPHLSNSGLCKVWASLPAPAACHGLSRGLLHSSLEKAMAPHSSTLAWKIPWMEEPGGLLSMGSLSRTRLSDFTFIFHFHALEKEMATHSSVLAWRIPGTAEPGGLTAMGLHRVGHD